MTRAIFVICLYLSLAPMTGECQVYCDNLCANNFVLGDFDDTIDDRYGGTLVSFIPEFVMQKRNKRSGQRDTHAVISDRHGKLLFYTNGCDVFDYRDSIIENGAGINPGSIHDFDCPDNLGFRGLQNIFFLPSAYDSTIYYLIYIGEIFNPDPKSPNLLLFDKIYISTISTEAGNGFGGIIDKDHVILEDTNMLGTPIDAVRHANGLDWWVITPDKWMNKWHTVLITESGGQYMGAQTVGELHSDKSSGAQGRFSPDGSKFAWYHPWNGIFMFEFDRSTGTLSDFNKIEVSQGANQNGFAGLEFSPSGRFLYISNYFSLFQLDMKAEDLAASLTHIADYDGFADPEPFYTSFLYMARTQDKRIFMNPQSGSQWLHVIQEPEKKGVDCRFEQHVIQLPTVNNFAFPFFPTYTLGALGEPLCDTMTVADGFVSPNTLGLSVYPVPVDNTLYLNADTEISGASIYSVTGRLLSSYHQPNISSLDVTMLPMGLYFLHVTNKVGQRAVLRFCKN